MTRYAHRPPLELRFRWMPRSESKARIGPVWNGCCATRARATFALQRLEQVADDHIACRLPKPRPDVRTEVRLTLLDLIERLAALIPPPRLHRYRYYAVHRIRRSARRSLPWRARQPRSRLQRCHWATTATTCCGRVILQRYCSMDSSSTPSRLRANRPQR